VGIFAIGDLHLSNGTKPMDVFGEEWHNHDQKIALNWDRVVKPEDTVLIAGIPPGPCGYRKRFLILSGLPPDRKKNNGQGQPLLLLEHTAQDEGNP